MVAGVRDANAKIQSGSYFGCIDRSDAFVRLVFHRVVVVFIVAAHSTGPYMRLLQPDESRRDLLGTEVSLEGSSGVNEI